MELKDWLREEIDGPYPKRSVAWLGYLLLFTLAMCGGFFVALVWSVT